MIEFKGFSYNVDLDLEIPEEYYDPTSIEELEIEYYEALNEFHFYSWNCIFGYFELGAGEELLPLIHTFKNDKIYNIFNPKNLQFLFLYDKNNIEKEKKKKKRKKIFTYYRGISS